ncbi:MAG TPA: CocE/NonD family hydrolase [Gammaproteobacteria bacterium]|nr:CocE/NonD family hydrolase [Gammaproteobacteria bacterium]
MKKLILIAGLLLVGGYFSYIPNASSANHHNKIEITEVSITMSDGIRLAADIYWPAGADKKDRFPILLEYLPYRKDENRARNYSLYSYFLEHGYLVVRVDMRGTGNSEGITIPYEYSDIELDDGEEVIDWLSQQEWSTGSVGMFGISWGGFNSIQMAMRNPPALKAFVALMATEYLYQEDVHYMDGIMVAGDSWMMSNDLYNSLPGAPDFKMDEEWLRNRFNVEPSVYTYMRQQRDGAFWDRASARGQYEKIRVPGYHIGGWYDGYRNSLPRMLENVQAPVKAMIGPWDHYFPHNAWPKPQIEWRHEAVRWFDQWLKGEDTGILKEPAFAVYVRNYHPPDPDLDQVHGYWRWEDGWPIERIENHSWYAHADHSLSTEPAGNATHSMTYKPSIGLEGGGPTMWWGSIAPDQQPMDEYSLVYDSEILDAPLEILGRPIARLRVSANATRANWVVRVSDVAPDGQVTQVVGAAFNGTHRISAREPSDIVPGEDFDLNIDLHFTSWVFPKGHRIRIAVSNAIWPMLWPTPMQMKSTLAIGGKNGARIDLPVVPPGEEYTPNFKEPSTSPILSGYEVIDSGNISGYAAINSIQHDPDTGEAFGVATNTGATQYPWGIERFEEEIEHRTSDENPAYTSVIGRYKITEELKDRTLDFEQNVEFKSDEDNFYLTFHRWVSVNGELYKEKAWQEVIPRDFQ